MHRSRLQLVVAAAVSFLQFQPASMMGIAKTLLVEHLLLNGSRFTRDPNCAGILDGITLHMSLNLAKIATGLQRTSATSEGIGAQT